MGNKTCLALLAHQCHLDCPCYWLRHVFEDRALRAANEAAIWSRSNQQPANAAMALRLQRCAKWKDRIGPIAIQAVMGRRRPILQPGFGIFRSNSARIGNSGADDQCGRTCVNTLDDIVERGVCGITQLSTAIISSPLARRVAFAAVELTATTWNPLESKDVVNP